MSVRRGIIVVPNDHDMQVDAYSQETKSRAEEVISVIRKQLHLAEKDLSFRISAHSNSNRSNEKALKSLIGGGSDEDSVRVFYSDKRTDDFILEKHFKNNTLIVAIAETNGPAQIDNLAVGDGCRISASSEKARRLIEDVFIDIFMGRWVCKDTALKEFVERNDLGSLFREKARYFRKNSQEAWLKTVAKQANYAPLSSLNECDDDDVVGRAKCAIEVWKRFCGSLAVEEVSKTKKVEVTVLAEPVGTRDRQNSLRKLKKIGGQLPVSKIEATVSNYPAGEYLLMILRRSSSVRKKPKTRNKIQSVFGKNARINSFRVFSNESYASERRAISELIANGFAVGVFVEVSGGRISVSRTLDGGRK